jgi:hypothetical protein
VWDAKKIQGCVCDPKYSGFDCSEQICPNGDDPLTQGQVGGGDEGFRRMEESIIMFLLLAYVYL